MLISVVFAGVSLTASAQLYDTGLGARAGFFNGLTAKHFFQENRAVEGILSTRWNGFIITGLYEIHNDIPDVEFLEWYYGAGAHIGFWGRGDYHHKNSDAQTIVGFDLVIGAEYVFEEFPVSIGIDWKPAFNVFGDFHWWGDGVAISGRYTFR